jgi:hypothetical protein
MEGWRGEAGGRGVDSKPTAVLRPSSASTPDFPEELVNIVLGRPVYGELIERLDRFHAALPE